MTPASAAARSHARAADRSAPLKRPTAPRGPRRISGPARPARAARQPTGRGRAEARYSGARHAGGAAAVAPLGLRLVNGAGHVVDHRLLDRLIRGRAWIALVAFALIGIVAMQVTLLRLNTGISSSIQKTAALQRENTALQAQLSMLAGGDRVQAAAGQQGFVFAPAGDVRYLHPRADDPLRAMRALAAGLALPSSPSALAASSAAAGTGLSGSLATSGAGVATSTMASPAAASGSPTAAATATAPPTTTASPTSTGAGSSSTAAANAGSPTANAGAPSAGAGSQTTGTTSSPSGDAGGGTAASTASAGAGSASAAAGATAYPGGTGGR